MNMQQVRTPVDLPMTPREEAERKLIGAIFSFPNHHAEIFSSFTDPRYFDNDDLATVFRAALEVYSRGDLPDRISIKQAIIENNGDCPWLTPNWTVEISEEPDIPGSISTWKGLIVNGHRFSEFKREAAQALTIEHMERIAIKALEMHGVLSSDDEPEMKEAAEKFIARQDAIIRGDIEAGYSFGVPMIDNSILLRPGCFYTIGGLKKGGKSQLALSILDHNIAQGIPCFLSSLEMSVDDVLRKLVARRTGINSRKILTRRLGEQERNEVATAVETIVDGSVFQINQSPSVTTAEIVARVRTWKNRNKIPKGAGIVCVDFLQLVRWQSRNGQNEASAIKGIAYDLARLAKESGVAVIAVVQFKNEAEGHRPSIRFLEGSGGIAQASEGILLVDLPSRREETASGQEWEPFSVVIIQRNGESGIKIELEANMRTSEFREGLYQ